MTAKDTTKKIDPSQIKVDQQGRKTLPASEIGVSLRISEQALKEIEKLQQENALAAKESLKFSWR